MAPIRCWVLARIQAIRYVTPLREGGSLPGVVEADDLGTYVAKFRGAGQGGRALVAEVIVTELARSLGIRVPDLRLVELDETIAKYEADEEVQDLLKASVGLNLAVDFLPGAFGFDASSRIDPGTAGAIVWLDAYTANVDRTWRNPNLLSWHGNVWAIDHGAALYFHHSWPNGIGSAERFAAQPYDVSNHVLARFVAGVPPSTTGSAPRSMLPCCAGSWTRCPPTGWSPCPVPTPSRRSGPRTSTTLSPASPPRAPGSPDRPRHEHR